MPTLPSGVAIEFGTTYDIVRIDLSVAHDNDEIVRSGDVISVISITGELDIRINEKDEPAIEIDKLTRIVTKPVKFTRFYITNTAQAGKEATLYIGKEASFEPVPQRVGTVGVLDTTDARINPAREDGKLANLDVALSVLWRWIRWGKAVEPEWAHGGEITAPPANTWLVSRTVSAGKKGYFYGFLITAGEANDFRIAWTSGGEYRTIRIVFGGKGTTEGVGTVAMNEGMPADEGTTVLIQNINAGSAGVDYQARLLYAEE